MWIDIMGFQILPNVLSTTMRCTVVRRCPPHKRPQTAASGHKRPANGHKRPQTADKWPQNPANGHKDTANGYRRQANDRKRSQTAGKRPLTATDRVRPVAGRLRPRLRPFVVVCRPFAAVCAAGKTPGILTTVGAVGPSPAPSETASSLSEWKDDLPGVYLSR
eukprot:gene17415-biopygen804